MAIDFDAELTRIQAGGDIPTLSLTYAQGGNSKSITTAWRVEPISRGLVPGLDAPTTAVGVPADEFASGFSSSNPVVPAGRDVVTVSGEKAWEVEAAELVGGGTYYQLTLSQRVQRGTA